MSRECRCSCDALALVVRVVTLLGHCASMVAAGWGFIIANQRFSPCSAGGTGANCVVSSLQSLSSTYSYFQGLTAVYFIMFGALGIISEIRTKLLQRTVLKHLSFLASFFGRGILCIYVGSIWIVIPWDDSRDYVSKVPGGLLLGMGVIQLLLFVFVKKNKRNLPTTVSTNPMLVASGGGGATPGQKIAWGTSAGSAEDSSTASPDFAAAAASGGIGHSVSRQGLLAAPSGGIANPVHAAALASFAPTPVGADDASVSAASTNGTGGGRGGSPVSNGVSKNPFLQPPPGAVP